MSSVLADYLAAAARRRFAYGVLDCCTFMADWLLACDRPDVMADRRGTYATRAEYRAAIRSEGGLRWSCARRFAQAGLRLTTTPAAGDVGLVLAPIAVRRGGQVLAAPTGAIRVTERLSAIVTADAGLVAAVLPAVEFWTFTDA